MACNEKNPLQRDGSSQAQRVLTALGPDSAPVQELDMREWLLFAAEYAERVLYYQLNNSEMPQGNWKSFFIQDADELDAFLEEAELKIKNAENDFEDTDIQSDVEPHLALFMCFLLLLQHSKDALNDIPGRHLDFYFKEVLQLRNRDEVPDKVHLIFELAKNAAAYTLPKGTTVDAGKDKGNKPKQLLYATSNELVVNSAAIAAMKSLYNNKDEDETVEANKEKKIQYADVTFSSDGLGTPIDEDVPKWNAFGNAAWPVASLGFAFASKVLLLSEGERTITVKLSFEQAVDDIASIDLTPLFVVFFTSEKEWIQGEFPGSGAFTLSDSNKKLTIKITLPVKAAAVTPYDQTIHLENYQTDLPVMRLLMTTEGEAYAVYEALAAAKLVNMQIDVNVKGMKNLSVENDNGKLDPSKPFLPFGSQPRKGSNLYIGSTEIFQKNWTDIKPTIEWKNVPADLKAWYTAYRKNYISGTLGLSTYDITSANQSSDSTGGGRVISSSDSFTADVTYIRDGGWYPTGGAQKQVKLFTKPYVLTPEGISQQTGGWNNFVGQFLYFNMGSGKSYDAKAQSEKVIVQNTLNTGNKYSYLGFSGFANLSSGIQTETQSFSSAVKDNYIRITLTQDFMHDVYPQLFAIAMLKASYGALLPNPPYTPEIASLTIEYDATATNDASALSASGSDAQLSDYVDRSIQFFHETPFGQAEQHMFLKSQYAGHTEVEQQINVMPAMPATGAFYIGISGIEPGSVASILFQVSEGSEDPEKPSFTDGLQPQWYFLSANEWILFDKTDILYDDTNDFLRSGIIKFMIPDGAVNTNTFLNKNLVWLGVTLPGDLSVDSVCKFINVHIQAEEAEFLDQDNELSHLETGLPAETIAKLVSRLPQIKSVTQPYASFGGSLPETDEDFRLRISERLRHKHRAVNIWDYERLVLAQFPQVYRAKCLNHTKYKFIAADQKEYCEVAPGYVTVVVVPDIRNQNSFDPFKPRVSRNTLSEIREYLVGINNMHVDTQVINPEYEEVTFAFEVVFYTGYDKNQYEIQLNNDIINYLSPWAFDNTAEIDFGGTLYKSVVIRYIEELLYVDYIANFKMYFTKDGSGNNDVLQASDARAILVSAKQHSINLDVIPVCP